MRIAPTDTTPLSDENAPEPTRPSPPRKRAPAQKSHGARRVDVARRTPKDSDPRPENKDSDPRPEKKPPQQTEPAATKAPATKTAATKTDSAPKSPSDRSAPGVPGPKVAGAPKAVWADRGTDGPPRIPDWDESALDPDPLTDVGRENGREATVLDIPVHVAPLTRRRRRSRVFVTAVVLLCLLFAFVAVAAIRSSHNPTTPAASPRVAPPAPEVASSRVLKATHAADAAIILTRSALDAISGLPTLTNVAAIINPYVSALQNYETALTGAVVPSQSLSTLSGVRSLVRQDAQFLGTINVLPSLDLGTYLAEAGRRSTQLQAALSELRGELHTATS